MLSLFLLQDAGSEILNLGTVWDHLAAGGPVMIPLGLCSVVALAIAGERYLRLTRGRVLPRSLDHALELVNQGNVTEALAAAEQVDAPAGRILTAGLRRRGLPIELVEKAMEDQGRKELDRLQGNIKLLSLIANVAPLLGLLGTVTGIMKAFHQVSQVGMGKPEQLAGGISEALIATTAGLAVAIPSLLLSAFLAARMRRLLLAADERLAPAVEKIAETGGTRHAA
jgi:biopolymer transport protein ExbB